MDLWVGREQEMEWTRAQGETGKSGARRNRRCLDPNAESQAQAPALDSIQAPKCLNCHSLQALNVAIPRSLLDDMSEVEDGLLFLA
uniref:Uncharacterized protein n=1 Tax=Leersia perrieri TaxID=77586 RepID=A0A0D9WNE3_9ORYZ